MRRGRAQLEAQLGSAQQEVLDGHRRRQHLEDELRRTLLKGINAMNLEALNIFNSVRRYSQNCVKDSSYSCQLISSLTIVLDSSARLVCTGCLGPVAEVARITFLRRHCQIRFIFR